ncbi:MAG: nucleoid-associated protein, YbaB/EbfC family [Gammaproteobacteria bacterium RIFCSPHIGHO2_12_FULL_43_28]|nr:MAG: nucleoid-associated protein, YbaB/EbfC family [Gammaproteobacteria bacterium RIFCSPHIGHO2_12_FULL_43_28]
MNKPGESKVGLNDIMKRAQEMQKKLQEIQKQVADMEVIGQSGGGMVKITMTGQHYAKKVVLDSNLLKDDKAIIEDLIAAAINDATDKIEKNLREKMGSLAGMKMPDGFGGL